MVGVTGWWGSQEVGDRGGPGVGGGGGPGRSDAARPLALAGGGGGLGALQRCPCLRSAGTLAAPALGRGLDWPWPQEEPLHLPNEEVISS